MSRRNKKPQSCPGLITEYTVTPMDGEADQVLTKEELERIKKEADKELQ